MTTFKYLALSSLICGLLAPSALAAPISSTSGDWWWWSPVYASAAASNLAPNQFANSFYGPSATSSTPTAPVSLSNYVPATAATVLAPTPAPASAPVANANLNLGSGPYPLESTITTGNAQPWYNSSQISSFFGGQPTAQQVVLLRQRRHAAGRADVPAERSSHHADLELDRPRRPHAEPGLQHRQ